MQVPLKRHNVHQQRHQQPAHWHGEKPGDHPWGVGAALGLAVLGEIHDPFVVGRKNVAHGRPRVLLFNSHQLGPSRWHATGDMQKASIVGVIDGMCLSAGRGGSESERCHLTETIYYYI